jgi:DNA-directed RNA polymerase specialized sigma24 family protein
MATEEQLTTWIDQIRSGSDDAACELCQQYAQRLANLARKRLAGMPLRDRDEDDIAQSALASFFRRAGRGDFPELTGSDELEKLLCTITACKAYKERRRQLSLRRGAGQVRGESAFAQPELARIGGIDQAALDRSPDQDPEVDDLLLRMCEVLGDETLEQVLLLRTAGYTVAEVALQMDIPSKRIEYKLQRIRRKLQPFLDRWFDDAAFGE